MSEQKEYRGIIGYIAEEDDETRAGVLVYRGVAYPSLVIARKYILAANDKLRKIVPISIQIMTDEEIRLYLDGSGVSEKVGSWTSN
jgi:hypothetical protein